MSEMQGEAPLSEPAQVPMTAGGLLRQARLAKGLHIAALATSIKVAPRKLELLEADRFDELPGATFTRALAQTICRTLKIDAAPVLALLPQPVDQGLAQMSRGLNAPFRDKPGRRVPSDIPFLKSPVLLGAALLVLASVALYLLPAGWVNEITQSTAGRVTEPAATVPAEPAVVITTLPPPDVSPVASEPSMVMPAASAGAASEVAAVVAAVAEPASAPITTASAASAVPPAAAPAVRGALLLRASAESWVEVVDARGNTLISRLLQGGETVGLDGPSPLKVKIGNASAVQVSFRGKPVDLVATRDNVAKLELR
jgi:cytoskeleton protein RodZ